MNVTQHLTADPAQKPVLKVGTLKSSDLVIASGGSRMHACIEYHDNEWFVIDLGSTAGVKVNGKRISKAALVSGDHLQFGPTCFMFLTTSDHLGGHGVFTYTQAEYEADRADKAPEPDEEEKPEGKDMVVTAEEMAEMQAIVRGVTQGYVAFSQAVMDELGDQVPKPFFMYVIGKAINASREKMLSEGVSEKLADILTYGKDSETSDAIFVRRCVTIAKDMDQAIDEAMPSTTSLLQELLGQAGFK